MTDVDPRMRFDANHIATGVAIREDGAVGERSFDRQRWPELQELAEQVADATRVSRERCELFCLAMPSEHAPALVDADEVLEIAEAWDQSRSLVGRV
jgi:hypothetical protein